MLKSNTSTSQNQKKPYHQMSNYKIKQQNYDHNLTMD